MRQIIDCHCHVYPAKIAKKAVDAIGAFYGLDNGFGTQGKIAGQKYIGNAAGRKILTDNVKLGIFRVLNLNNHAAGKIKPPVQALYAQTADAEDHGYDA